MCLFCLYDLLTNAPDIHEFQIAMSHLIKIRDESSTIVLKILREIYRKSSDANYCLLPATLIPNPPSTLIGCPVINAAFSLAVKTTRAAISSGWATR